MSEVVDLTLASEDEGKPGRLAARLDQRDEKVQINRLVYAITGNANEVFKSFHYADDDRFTRPLRNVLKHSLWNAQMSARHCKCPYSSAAHILSTSYQFVKSALSRVVP